MMHLPEAAQQIQGCRRRQGHPRRGSWGFRCALGETPKNAKLFLCEPSRRFDKFVPETRNWRLSQTELAIAHGGNQSPPYSPFAVINTAPSCSICRVISVWTT